MPIPFRDAEEIAELGLAAYLRIVPQGGGAGWLGALFTINARGEPVEFTYNRIDTPHTFLWRPDDVRRFAARRLAASLFTLCPDPPCVVFCLAGEVGSELFGRDLQVEVPICRIASGVESASHGGSEVSDAVEAGAPLNLFWTPDRPADGSPERRLLDVLVARGLAMEPFDRAWRGLQEVYGFGAGEGT